MGLGRMSAGGRGRSPEMLPGSEQWPRDVSTDHRHVKTSALLQNQPMVIYKDMLSPPNIPGFDSLAVDQCYQKLLNYGV